VTEGAARIERRRRILDAAHHLFEDVGIASTSRRDVAVAADVATRSVHAMAGDRSDLLALVTQDLPFPPTSQRLQEQMQSAEARGEALQTILAIAREAFGAPASVWDVIELQATVLAPFDEDLAQVVRERVALRWEAARGVVRQLRGEGGVDSTIDDDAAALHLLAVGAGLALLEGLTPRPVEAAAWVRLTSRLLESLAAIDPQGREYDGVTRPWRVRVTAPSTPAATARVLRVLALLGADVVSLFTHAQGDGTQYIDMICAAPESIERDDLTRALATSGHRVLVAPGRADDTDDIVTRVLDGAAGLVQHPERAPRAAADLVLADSWTVEPATEGEDASSDVMRLQWTPDHHVVLRRSGSPFADVERARASALLRLVDALASAPAGTGGFGWVEYLRDGTQVVIRLARPEDAEGVAHMHERSSETTRYQRYFTPLTDWREDQLRRVAGGHRGATLVAVNWRGDIVGLGNVFPDRPGDTATAEIAVIVEDAWQGRGLGGRLLEHLVELARRQGFDEVLALVLASNAGMIRLLERLDLDWTRSTDPDLGPSIVRMTAPLA
jgi:L-amino acid N-acyltransferase YncA/AcrR family transcriptional regulator/acetolactate synthase regulatory subunit